jgi:hypothetical protein
LDCKELKTRREKIKHKWNGNIKCVTFKESSQDEAIQIGPKSLWFLVIKLQGNSNKMCVCYNYTKLATYETDCGEIWYTSRSKSWYLDQCFWTGTIQVEYVFSV